MEGDSWDDEDNNKLLTLIGIIVGHLGILGYLSGALWPLFSGRGISGLGWYGWVFGVLGLVALAFEVFGLIKYLGADQDTNAATTFRAWRTNFLAQGAGAVVIALSFILWFVLALLARTLTSSYLYIGFYGGSFLFAGVAVYMMFFAKAWWYNNDESGSMRCHEDWSLFGNDDDYEEEADTADDHTADDAPAAHHDDTADEEW